ncbi:MAG: M1 family metallopeptidase [Gemmatimonadota bacterium]
MLAPADTPTPAHDAQHYDLLLTIPATGKVISGQMTTRWRLLSGGPFVVELDSVLVIRDVQLNGRPARGWERHGDVVTIPQRGQAGDSATTLIRYVGTPRDGLVIRDSLGIRTVFADNWPNRAHRWFPLQDHPSDKATVTFHVAAPNGYQVIANGNRTGPQPIQTGLLWTYDMDRPIPPATMVVGVAHMARAKMGDGGCPVRCVPVEVWTYADDSSYAVTGPFRNATGIIDYFSAVIGEFPYSRLTHVQSSTIFGGMENSTAIFYDEKAYRKHTLTESTVAHETAHQWFGDAVTERDWSHLWLSEGFATYFAALWAEHLGGDSALQETMTAAAEEIFKSPVTERPVIDTASNLMDLLNTNNYNKGGWVLHSLRGLLGDSTFFRGIRDYYATYRDSTVLSLDFEHSMETASGQDLTWYFHQALTQPGYPKLDITSRYDSTRHQLAMTVRQVQPESWGTYRLPGFELLVGGMLVRVDIDGRESKFSFDQFTENPGRVEADPNGWWLFQAVSGEQ